MDMTEHSKKFPDVKSYYDHRIWSKATGKVRQKRLDHRRRVCGNRG